MVRRPAYFSIYFFPATLVKKFVARALAACVSRLHGLILFFFDSDDTLFISNRASKYCLDDDGNFNYHTTKRNSERILE